MEIGREKSHSGAAETPECLCQGQSHGWDPYPAVEQGVEHVVRGGLSPPLQHFWQEQELQESRVTVTTPNNFLDLKSGHNTQKHQTGIKSLVVTHL